eukprot:8066468-Lingulodinium_polyedra.AAC.1
MPNGAKRRGCDGARQRQDGGRRPGPGGPAVTMSTFADHTAFAAVLPFETPQGPLPPTRSRL